MQNLIKQATGDRNAVLAPRVFIDLLDGDHNAALVLNQVLYWSERCTHPDGWFYKTYAEWQAELGMSKYQVKRVFDGDPRVQQRKRTLRDVGVETVVRRAPNGSPTVHYRVDVARFFASLKTFLMQQFGFQPDGDSPAPAASGDNVAFGKSTMSLLEGQQCALSSYTEITTKNSSEISSDNSNDQQNNDEDDLKALKPFEKRFGKLKKHLRTLLLPLVAALGEEAALEVLGRCVGRGRSWHYVARALSNEIADRQKQTQPAISITAAPAVDVPPLTLTPVYPDVDEPALTAYPPARGEIIPDGSVQTAWNGQRTVSDVWEMAYNQLELQMDRGNFSFYVKNLRFVHFEPVTGTFSFVTDTPYQRDMLTHRIGRQIKSVLQIAFGAQTVHAEYMTAEEWTVRTGSSCDDPAHSLPGLPLTG